MKILYVSTVSLTTIFFPEQMKKLVECGHTVEFACHIETEINPIYSELGIKFHNLPFSRSPFSKGNLLAYKQLKALVEAEHYDIVHCHTPNAAVITRLACRKVRKQGTKVIYTAHGFHFFKGVPIKNWLLFYPVERFCARLTDVLITINQEDYSLAQQKMPAKKVCYVPGVGINLKKIDAVACDRAAVRKSIGVPEDCILLFSVGELNVNKNHQVILKAMAKVNNPKVHYAIAGVGDQENSLLQLAKELGLEKQFHLLGYRRDVFALDKAADIFCFPSHREGLSVSLMEAMACGLPAVCSKIRGNVDLIQQGKGGYLCKSTDGDAFADALAKLCSSADFRNTMGHFNREYVKKFSVENVVERVCKIYDQVLLTSSDQCHPRPDRGSRTFMKKWIFTFLTLLFAQLAFAAEPTVNPDRMRNLRQLESSPLLFEYHRLTTGDDLQYFAYPRRNKNFRRDFDKTEKDALIKYGESDFKIAASLVGGLDYRGGESLNDTIWPGIDGGLFLRGYLDSLDFSLDARMYVESHSATTHPKSYDMEVFDEQYGDVTYVSYSRYRGHMGFNWNRVRVEVARDVLHWGPGFYNNVSLNQFALPYNILSVDLDLGPLHVVSAYGDLRVGEVSWDEVNKNDRNMYAHRYELALGNLTLGMTELQILYNENKPMLFVPVVPLFIEKGNFAEISNNGSLSFDANYRLLNFMRVYSEFMLDDMESPSDLIKNESTNNRWAFMAGMQMGHDFTLANQKLEAGTILEYARVEPYTYTHHDSAKAQLANLNYPIGNPNGPNSQTIDWLLYGRMHHVFASVRQRFYWKGTTPGSSIDDAFEWNEKNYLKGAKMKYSLTPSLSYEGQYVAFMGSVTLINDQSVYLRIGFKW